MKALKSLLAAAAVSIGAMAPLAAHATLTLTIQDITWGGSVTIVDGGLGDTDGLANGLIGYNSTVGVWTTNVGLGVGTANLNPYGIDLFNASLLNTKAGTVRVTLVETGLTQFGGSWANLVGSIGGTTSGTVNYALLADATTAFSGSSAAHMTGGLGFSDSGGANVLLGNPYTLTLTADITHATARGDSTFDFRGSIPEPASLALVGLALVGAGLASRRRRQA